MMKHFFCILAFILSYISEGAAVTKAMPGTEEDIIAAVKAGNAAQLAKYFTATIDLTVPENELSCSKTQAELIMKDFFRKNPPQSFSIKHQGASRDGARFLIGSYTTVHSKVFRTYFLLKKDKDRLLIQQLQFEAE